MRVLTKQRSAPRPAAARRPVPALVAAAGLLLVLAGGRAPAWGAFFPSTDPVQFVADDFESGSLANYTPYSWPSGWTPNWYVQTNLGTVDDAKGGVWGSNMVREDQAWLGRRSVLVINGSGSDPTRWTNLEVQADISPVGNEEVGLAFGLHDDDSDGLIDRGYVIYFDTFPSAEQADHGARAIWHLVRLTSDAWNAGDEVGRGFVELDGSSHHAADQTMVGGGTHVYRVRVRYFCNNLQVQAQRVYNPLGTTASFRGCGVSCPSPSPDCWCTVVEWLERDGASLTPGMAGLYAGGTENLNVNHRFDNLSVAAWEESCYQVCDDWLGWDSATASAWDTYDAATANEKTETLEFKHLYEGALHDYAMVAREPSGRIDNDVYHDELQACAGWSLAVDMPDVANTVNDGQGANLDDLMAFLEPMATAVNLVDHESPGSCGGGVLGNPDLCFEDAFDDNPDSATYNPVPIITYGSTPIAKSLENAYDWYKEIRTNGAWRDDVMAACRSWYIILITDGEETCPLDNPDDQAACDVADWFGDPAGEKGDVGLDPVKIYTIGFAGGFTDNGESPVKCVSDNTGGEYRTAASAAELSTVLYDVINRMEERDRSFSPFKVSPPASALGGYQETRDYLAVFPFFVPRKDRSIWDGSLYAFKLNRDTPTLPASDDCQIDFSQMLWDAGAALEQQVLTGTQADPKRKVFMGLESGGVWSRYDLADIRAGGNATLRTAFASLLNPSSPASSLETQEVVNFLRYMWVDDDTSASPDPQWPAISGFYPGGRPVDNLGTSAQEMWGALGDVYHSQPVLLNPPNTSMYYYDYGFGSAHDYPDFMIRQAKRRRVALAGANDGMLHAFDAGFYNRDTTNYADQHDLGTGAELFAYVPHAVFDRLHTMVYGVQQDYLVDGPITVADVYIAPAADASPEWRTVALATMRRGGRGVVALDITQPDPVDSDGVPTESVLPGCLSGSASSCSGEYPKVLWEFEDTADDDVNCPTIATDCTRYQDLGWTWSKPAVARIGVYNATHPDQPDDVFVAFFGGGWDPNEDEDTGTDYTGLHIYGVNIETGEIVLKHKIGVAVPGSFTALDSNLDGFHDRIYFGDSDGGLWRISYPSPDSTDALGPELVAEGGGATLTKIYDFSAANADGGMDLRQRFFARPVTVPVGFAGQGFQWALAIGAGDRADLGDRSAVVDGTSNQVNAFYFVMDVDDTTRGIANLVAVNYADLAGDLQCSDGSALDPDNGHYGWYLTLRANEKVNFEATVVNGHVFFPTFESTDDIVDSPPDACGSTTPEERPSDVENLCTAFGIGRMYNLWFECGQGEETALNDIVTGVEDYTINGITYVTASLSEPVPGPSWDLLNSTGYSATNWRQD